MPEPRLLSSAGDVLLDALLFYLGTGLHPWWPLPWLAPVPILVLASRASVWRAATAGLLAWLLGSLNMWGYYHGVLNMPSALLLLAFLPGALVFALAVALFRALRARGADWSALVAFPSLWVSFEYLLSLASPHGTAGSLAYSQLEFLPFLQLASVTGPWGMSFLVLLFSASLAIALTLRSIAPRRALAIFGASATILVSVLTFGAVRLAQPARGTPVRVALVASDLPGYVDVAGEGAGADRLLRAYARQAEAAAHRGVRAIVLPEKLAVVSDRTSAETDALFQGVADRTGALVVVGLVRVSPPLRYNRARIYRPSLPALDYDKHHLLPFFESQLQPGTGTTLLQAPSGTWGVAICKDMDFTGLAREYGRSRVAAVLVPAWDFVVDRWAHGHMAVMRGVESGFAVVRSARQGYLTVSDSRGRILAEKPSDAGAFATLVAELPVAHDETLYSRWGDWFAWLALATLGLTLAKLLLSAPAATAQPTGSSR